MAALFAILLAVFYSQVVNTTRQHVGTEGTFIAIPLSPDSVVISGNASMTINWLRWERTERWLYTWSQSPVVKLCNANSNVITLLRLYVAVGETPDSPFEVPMWKLQRNCTAYPVRISAGNCDPASIYFGVNATVPLGEEASWSVTASVDFLKDCGGGIGAATFYVTVSILLLLILTFTTTLCVGVHKYCTKTLKKKEYELVATTDTLEIREY